MCKKVAKTGFYYGATEPACQTCRVLFGRRDQDDSKKDQQKFQKCIRIGMDPALRGQNADSRGSEAGGEQTRLGMNATLFDDSQINYDWSNKTREGVNATLFEDQQITAPSKEHLQEEIRELKVQLDRLKLRNAVLEQEGKKLAQLMISAIGACGAVFNNCTLQETLESFLK